MKRQEDRGADVAESLRSKCGDSGDSAAILREAKHTPWKAVTDEYADSASVVDSSGAELVSVGYLLSDHKRPARVSREIEKEETDSIVRLFAAAPDLLEALEEARDIIAIFHGPAGLAIYLKNAPEMKRIKAAIAKATGGAA